MQKKAVVNHNKDLELIAFFDYQVLNFGMEGWLVNDCYKDVFDYMTILQKRGTSLDKKVMSIFQKVVIIGMELFKYRNVMQMEDIRLLYPHLEIHLGEYERAYSDIAKPFMNSYGMEDYNSAFNKALFGE